MECARVSIVREREEQVSLRVIPQNPTIKQLLTATPAIPILALRVAFWHGHNRHDLIADSRSSTVFIPSGSGIRAPVAMQRLSRAVHALRDIG
jgi:hypothetical protein